MNIKMSSHARNNLIQNESFSTQKTSKEFHNLKFTAVQDHKLFEKCRSNIIVLGHTLLITDPVEHNAMMGLYINLFSRFYMYNRSLIIANMKGQKKEKAKIILG